MFLFIETSNISRKTHPIFELKDVESEFPWSLKINYIQFPAFDKHLFVDHTVQG